MLPLYPPPYLTSISPLPYPTLGEVCVIPDIPYFPLGNNGNGNGGGVEVTHNFGTRDLELTGGIYHIPHTLYPIPYLTSTLYPT